MKDILIALVLVMMTYWFFMEDIRRYFTNKKK